MNISLSTDISLSELEFKYSDELAAQAVARAIDRSRASSKELNPFPDVSAIADQVREEALAELIAADEFSAVRRRTFQGFGPEVVPEEKWSLHVTRVMWKFSKIPARPIARSHSATSDVRAFDRSVGPLNGVSYE